MKEDYIVENRRYKMVPPDGGWGYMICVAAIINFITMTMFGGSFGMVFKELLVELNMGSTSVTLLSGISLMCVALSGYFTSALLRLLSIRNLAFLASILMNIGVFCTIFVHSQFLFFLCQGLQSIGMGVLWNITCTLLNDYFLKKRLMAMSFTQTISAAGGMVAPLIVKWSLEANGFRGTLFVISAISLHTFVAVALIQPVTKHMVKVEIEKTTDELKLLINEKAKPGANVATPTITLTDTESGFEAKADNCEKQEKNTGSKRVLDNFVDLPLLKKFLLSNASMGPTFCLFADLIFNLMLPQALYSMNWSEDQVAKALSLASCGDLVTRIAFVFLSKWLTKIGNQEVCLISVALAFVSRLCMLWSENTTVMMIFITTIGVARCSFNVLPPVILADTFSPAKFTSVLGIYMLMVGLMNLVLGPAIGAIRDTTNSYSTAFYVITSCFAVVLLLWTIELLYKKNKHKRIIQREAAEKLKKMNSKNKGKK
ncbi:monocarboxylate transporter 1-like [Pectinophora gossypiella]|uniref:monocarboxylate transporter 1-like n=1 Tax=Pectinophora gossypiella TaxID=13191 RepID=UPI00214ED798|nr:monocarboxylate transporter 1-like [Pectinophora gossypiella]